MRSSGIDAAQLPLIGARPVGERTLEVRQVLLGHRHGFDLVGDGDVDDAIELLHAHRADLGRVEHAQPATFDHRRATHPDVGVGRCDHHVATPEHRRIPREAVARVDPDERYQGAEPAEIVERPAVEHADADSVGVAGTASPAFGEEHDRQAHRFGEIEQSILLAVVLLALRASQHGVVVRHGDDLSGVALEQVSVDGADSADHAVGRRAFDELGDGAATTLGSDHDRAVLDERSFVDEIGDVLAGGAPTHRASLGDRVGPCRVEPDGVAGLHLGEVGANVGRDRTGGYVDRRPLAHDAGLDRGDGGARHHRRAGLDEDRRRPCRRTELRSRGASSSTRSASAAARHARCRLASRRRTTIVPCIGASTVRLPHAPDGSWRDANTVAVVSDPVEISVAGRTVSITSPDKVFFTTRGDTKLDLVKYYLRDRRGGDAPDGRPPGAAAALPQRRRRVDVLPEADPRRRARSGCTRRSCRRPTAPRRGRWSSPISPTSCGRSTSAASGSTRGRSARSDLEHCDELRIDLDPGPGTTFAMAQEAAALLQATARRARRARVTSRPPATAACTSTCASQPTHDSVAVRSAAVAVARELERRHAGPHHRIVVEGGARRAHLHRLQPERSAQDRVRPVVGAGHPITRRCRARSRGTMLPTLRPHDMTIATVPGAGRRARRPVGDDGRRAAVARAVPRDGARRPGSRAARRAVAAGVPEDGGRAVPGRAQPGEEAEDPERQEIPTE